MSLQACADIVHRADPARWRAAMAAPLHARKVMLPIYAANSEMSRAPWVTQEPVIAMMRLQWWRDALAELNKGTPRRHEVIDALAQLPAPALQSLIVGLEARQADVDKMPFDTPDAMIGYARDTTYGAMAACFLALNGPATDLPKLLDLATGLGLARVFQATLDLKGAGWDILGHHITDDIIRDMARTGLDALTRAKDLHHPAGIEAAGAHWFLRHTHKSPTAVQAGSLPGYSFQTAFARAKYAWQLR